MLNKERKDSFFNKNKKYFDFISNNLKNVYNEPKAFVRTYGCQQNVADSEKFKGMLQKMGYEIVSDPKEASFILFNTCAVREHAEDRVFGNVGALKSLKRRNPNMIIALCGCMMEQEHISNKIKMSFPFVDLVFGTHSMEDFPKLIYKVMQEKKRVFEHKNDERTICEHVPTFRDGKFKAFLPIMYGCDNFCSYCVVPYVRGREKSRECENIIEEARDIIESGYKEITLLGQNVNSYGKTLDNHVSFAQLLKKVDDIDGDYWIRFMTSHPKDAKKELINTMASGKHICNHLHLPVQSGSNRILKLMNRHYTKEQYLEIIYYAKEKLKDVSLTSDIIVGFPGETYDDFCETLELIKEVSFSSLYTFIYSKRVGTKAALMKDPISYQEKSQWFNELLKVQNDISKEYCKKFLNRKMRVLVEGKAVKDGNLTARSSENLIVDIKGNEDLIGKFVNVKIVEAKDWFLKGNLI